ncbi:hypothetical protein ACSBPU_15775 [Parapusillimonas sp. JC17]|uniref:hypothetical protein n=1 Tax=Parapusillimonas sp. JC17 TaxID=3445768 RepID=UPI003F9F9145
MALRLAGNANRLSHWHLLPTRQLDGHRLEIFHIGHRPLSVDRNKKTPPNGRSEMKNPPIGGYEDL